MDTIIPLRHCKKCGNDYSPTLEYFYADKRTKNGFRSPCKKCIDTYTATSARQNSIKSYRKSYYEDHAEEIKDASSVYYQIHKEQISSRERQYRETHKERIRAYRQQYTKAHWKERLPYLQRWMKEHPGRNSVYQKRYYYSHREIINLKTKQRYHANQPAEVIRGQQYRRTHQEECRQYHRFYRMQRKEVVNSQTRNRRARKRNAEGKHTSQDIQKQRIAQKGKCYWCHKKLEAYHVDHILPLSRGGSNWPDNLVLACPSCNTSRNNKMPHEFFQGGRLL